MGEGRHDDGVPLLDEGGGHGLESPAGARDDPRLVGVEELRQLAMEVIDARPGDLVQPERLPAVVAGRVAVPVGDDGLPGFWRQSARRLDRVYVDLFFLPRYQVEVPDSGPLRYRIPVPALYLFDILPGLRQRFPELLLLFSR